MKSASRERSAERFSLILALVLTVSLFLSLLPLIAVAFYNHPRLDDYSYSECVKRAVERGGGLTDTVSAALQMVRSTYIGWQGSYAAVFLFCLQPGAFSEKLCFLTTLVMLCALIASTMALIDSAGGALGYPRRYRLIISGVILILSIHFVVDKHEAFYWWNGSSYYTLFYAFALLLFSLLIRLYGSRRRGERLLLLLPSLVLSALIGGGNYSTALTSTVLFVLALCAAAKYRRELFPWYLAIFLVLLGGFAVSVLAPGNQVRSATVEGEGAVKAILRSVLFSVYLIGEWTGTAQLAGCLVIAGIAFYLTRESSFPFRYPLLVLVFSLLLFATQLTPPLYAMSSLGGPRQINIYYYSYYLLLTFDLFYLCGWLNRNRLRPAENARICERCSAVGLLLAVLMFFSGCINYGIYRVAFLDTLRSLAQGVPQTYSTDYMERVAAIQSGVTELTELETVPDYFWQLDISEDGDYWVNRSMARYYGGEKIIRVDTVAK